MGINFNKLYDANKTAITSDVSKTKEILEFENILLVISKEIINYRKNNNITQKQLADILKVNQSMISKLESGEFNPTFKNVYQISNKLTSSSELFIKILESIITKLTHKTEANYIIKNTKTSYSNNSNNNIFHFSNKYINDYSNIGGYYNGQECAS